MALYLTESDVESLLTMPEAVDALEGAFVRQAAGDVINQSRRRLFLPDGTYHTMTAADLGLGTFAIKTYTAFRPGTRFLVLLYDAKNGDLLSMLEADKLGQMRTGAASGVATKYLARKTDAAKVGIYGTGWQAESQLEAIHTVIKIGTLTAYSRDAAKRQAFCEKMQTTLGVTVVPAEKPEEAARAQDIVITATSAVEPVLRGEWLEPGAHVNAAGSNLLMKREIDEETVRQSGLIVVDSIEQAKLESGDLLPAYERRLFRWEQVAELAAIVGKTRPGRTSDEQITLFKSNGIAMEDVAVATLVYRKAKAAGVGLEIPLWQGT